MRLTMLVAGGLVVGALDFLDAVVFFGLRSGPRRSESVSRSRRDYWDGRRSQAA